MIERLDSLFSWLPAIWTARAHAERAQADGRVTLLEIVDGVSAVIAKLPRILDDRNLGVQIRATLNLFARLATRAIPSSEEEPAEIGLGWLSAFGASLAIIWGAVVPGVDATAATNISEVLRGLGFDVMYGPEQGMPEGKIRAYVAETG